MVFKKYFQSLIEICSKKSYRNKRLDSKYKPKRLFCNKIKIAEFIIDETQIKVGSELIWLWVIIELESKEIIGMSLSKERNMFFVAERFISSVIQIHGKHPVSTDGGGTWYPQACRFLNLKHQSPSFLLYEKSVIEKELCNSLRIELNALMTIFHVKRRIVN